MSRGIALFALFMGIASAQIWPEQWYGSARSKVAAAPVDDTMLWAEYAGDSAERAVYNGPAGRFTAQAWRLKDATGALAWYQAIRPEACVPMRGTLTMCTTPGAQVIAHQNYVLWFEGWRPLEKEMAELYGKLPRLRNGGGLPLLTGYLPEKDRVRNSERYVLGLRSLEKFLPGVPASVAGIEEGAEAQVGTYRVGGGEARVAVFSFITPQLAMTKVKELEKVAGLAVKRSGPLVGVVSGVADQKAAEAILAPLEWKADFIWNQSTTVPKMPDVGGMLVAIFELTGFLLVVCVGGGMVFAFFWVYLRKRRTLLDGTDPAITVLQLWK
ncbi:MAG: hypothetical protein IPP47_06110 [Bryobacterales bacterium]|nr:hypothetical protein [Bryobacterales bacterium]